MDATFSEVHDFWLLDSEFFITLHLEGTIILWVIGSKEPPGLRMNVHNNSSNFFINEGDNLHYAKNLVHLYYIIHFE